MAVDGFDLSEIDSFTEGLIRSAEHKFPQEARKFMRQAGKRMTGDLKSAYKSQTKKKTGNLIRGVRNGRPYVYHFDDYQIRVRNTAPHAHLLEHGHVAADHGGNPFRNKSGEEVWVDGRHIAGRTAEKEKADFPKEVDKWVDDMLERGFDL